MTHLFVRRVTSLFLLLILSTALPALAKEEQTYTIKKGDTLWGLSQRFIEDPYYWPNMWANNPDISNPHLIFPGQKIRVKDGRLEIIPAYPGAKPPEKAEQPETAAAEFTAQEAVKINKIGSGDGFILTDEKPLGLLVDSVDSRILLSQHDLVFIKMQDTSKVTIGDAYGLFQRGEPVKHPETNQLIGTMMNDLGYLQVTEVNDDSVIAKIDYVFREITRGAELFEYVPDLDEITLQRGKTDLAGFIIENRDEKLTLGTNDIIFINLGKDDGLLSGNLFYISRPRKPTKEMTKHAGKLTLPDEVLGAAVVIETNQKTASAIIIKSVDAMFIGDKVTIVKN